MRALVVAMVNAQRHLRRLPEGAQVTVAAFQQCPSSGPTRLHEHVHLVELEEADAFG